jgi:uncharacterized protein YgfB (UPF0149 family)
MDHYIAGKRKNKIMYISNMATQGNNKQNREEQLMSLQNVSAYLQYTGCILHAGEFKNVKFEITISSESTNSTR